MNQPFKFRNVNQIVGLFVVLALLLLVTGIVLAGKAQRWFQPSLELRVRFPAEGTLGVEKGAKIVILGAQAGQVERIQVDDDGSMCGILHIQSEYGRFIRLDAHALVKKTFGVAGDSFVEIITGKKEIAPLHEIKGTFEIPIEKDTELLEIAQTAITQIREAVLPGLRELETTLAEYRGLAADLRAPQGPLNTTISNLNATVVALNQTIAGLNRGEGSAGKILRDAALYDESSKAVAQINELLKQLGETMKQVDAIAGDIHETTRQLPPMAGKINRELSDAPGVVLQTQGTLREAEKTLQGVQRHWLLRGYVPAEQPLEMLSSDRAAAPTGGAR